MWKSTKQTLKLTIIGFFIIGFYVGLPKIIIESFLEHENFLYFPSLLTTSIALFFAVFYKLQKLSTNHKLFTWILN